MPAACAKSCARKWTPEQRQRQAEKIRAWSPWAQSTGPRSLDGKAVAARNAWKGGSREMLREIARALGVQREGLDQFQGRQQ